MTRGIGREPGYRGRGGGGIEKGEHHMAARNKGHILDGIKTVIVYNMETSEEIAVITADTITTAADTLVVKLIPDD